MSKTFVKAYATILAELFVCIIIHINRINASDLDICGVSKHMLTSTCPVYVRIVLTASDTACNCNRNAKLFSQAIQESHKFLVWLYREAVAILSALASKFRTFEMLDFIPKARGFAFRFLFWHTVKHRMTQGVFCIRTNNTIRIKSTKINLEFSRCILGLLAPFAVNVTSVIAEI